MRRALVDRVPAGAVRRSSDGRADDPADAPLGGTGCAQANDAVFGRWPLGYVRGMLRCMHERLSIQDVVGMLTDVR
jgi:hypothetical protein